jgi:hypothetical protein
MPSTWENIRVSGTMLLRDGLALSPILAAYQVCTNYIPADHTSLREQGKSLIPPPSPSGATQLIIAVIAATGLSTLFEFAPMLLGLRPPASKSPLFFPVTTFVVLTDVGAWAATLVLARKGLTGRGDWLLDTMARLQLASSVLLGIGSVIRKCKCLTLCWCMIEED